MISVELKSPCFPSARLIKTLSRIIKSTQLCSMATTNADGTAHINTAFFCYDQNLNIYFVSDWHTKHCRNFVERPKTALTIFDSHQRWGTALRGMQFFGKASKAKETE